MHALKSVGAKKNRQIAHHGLISTTFVLALNSNMEVGEGFRIGTDSYDSV
jgi:hypothetical protein